VLALDPGGATDAVPAADWSPLPGDGQQRARPVGHQQSNAASVEWPGHRHTALSADSHTLPEETQSSSAQPSTREGWLAARVSVVLAAPSCLANRNRQSSTSVVSVELSHAYTARSLGGCWTPSNSPAEQSPH
jgi:hypothetical protein